MLACQLAGASRWLAGRKAIAEITMAKLPKYVLIKYDENAEFEIEGSRKDFNSDDELVAYTLEQAGYASSRSDPFYEEMIKVATQYLEFSGSQHQKGKDTAEIRLQALQAILLGDIARTLSILMETIP